MKKTKYNQGDLLRYSNKIRESGRTQLCVITEVFTLPDDASLFYRVMWLGDETESFDGMVYHSSHLDNSTMYSTVMRGQ